MEINLQIKPKEKFYRSLIKSLTWRVIGTASLIIVTYLFTKKIDTSLIIGGLDIIVNLLLYITHERIWERIRWGRSFLSNLSFSDLKQRSLIKAITWRITGTVATAIISFILTGHPFTSIYISITDLILNLIEYYLHERIWNKIKLGR